MQDFVSRHPLIISYGFYFVVFVFFSFWEFLKPRRAITVPRRVRWSNNLSLFTLNALLLQLLTTTTIANLAYIAWKNKWGLLNHLPLPSWVIFGISFLLLDLLAYGQHRLFHAVPAAWRFHRMHHSDLDVDASTGPRFHPFEALLAFAIRQGFILLVGPAVRAVIAFESLILIFSFFNHANIRLYPLLDRILRLVFITPDMHRVHHSTVWTESNSNFGFIFPWWDYSFRTYQARPAHSPEKMEVGLSGFRSPRFLRLPWLLAFPFLKKDGEAPPVK